MSFSRLAFLFAFAALLQSCEKEVNIDLGPTASRLVVEGRIETGQPPVVFLTRSIGFTEQVNLESLQNTFVHDAVITLSDGLATTTLKEYKVDTGGSGTSFSLYSLDTADRTALRFFGQNERIYRLQIVSDGKTYESVTKIPNPHPLDSIWAVKPQGSRAEKLPDSRLVYARYKDPDTPGNSTRYYTQINSDGYFPALNATYNDEVINGTEFTLRVGIGGTRTPSAGNFDSLGIAYVNDTVTVKWCAIDRAAFDFWNSYEYSQNTLGSPFASPINLRTNISNNALGIWAGYGVTYKTLVIRE